MKTKLAIKIVKREEVERRGEIERRRESADADAARPRAAVASARAAGNTVAAWVSEFRQRQRPQSKSAVSVNLFRDVPA